jgi:uncharacterized protein YciI
MDKTARETRSEGLLMFIVLLRFTDKKHRAGGLMEGHKAWIKRGFDEGALLLVGSLHSDLGGCLLAHGTARADVEARVAEDPFVAEGVVAAEILEVTPSRADERLSFLLDRRA